MKLALIGATGFVGSAILKEALDRKHEVTAIVRYPEKLNIQNSLFTAKKADVLKDEELAGLLRGFSTVVSAYNPGWTNPNIYKEFFIGSVNTQNAAKKADVKRFVVVLGAGSLYLKPGLQLIDTPEFPASFKAGASAARDYLNVLSKEKQLHWTALSPAIEMHQGTSGIRKGTYRTGLENPVFDNNNRSVISVEDIAVAIVDELENPRHIQQRFTVAY